MRGCGKPEEGDGRTHADKIENGGAEPADLRKAQREAAFEQDHRHAQRHERKQQVTQRFIRAERPCRHQPTQYRPQDDAGNQQEQNCRQLHPPCQPLAQEAQQQQARDHQTSGHPALIDNVSAHMMRNHVTQREPGNGGILSSADQPKPCSARKRAP